VTLLRQLSRVDDKGKVAISDGIRRQMGLKPGNLVELKLLGIPGARKIVMSKLEQPR